MKDIFSFTDDLRNLLGENFIGFIVFSRGKSDLSVVVVVDEITSPRVELSTQIMILAKQYLSINGASVVLVKEVKKFLRDRKVTQTYGRPLLIFDEKGKILKSLGLG